MKKSNCFPAGPILMGTGIILMVLCALATELFPWLRVIFGLAGFVLFFVGFRFFSGPSYFLCPNCGTKIHKQNQFVKLWRKESALRCPKCQTLLRTDGGMII